MRWLERLVKWVTRLGTIRGLGSEINVTTIDHTTPTLTARPFEFLKRVKPPTRVTSVRP